jgi:glycosyltransferase involved in cell wall biosynthesis
MTMDLQIAVPSRSLGPRRAASDLTEALVADGVSARLVERPEPGGGLNAHLSNSSRSLLLPLARRRRCLVTLHDVVPRSSRAHRALSPIVLRILRRHRVVVHSRHAADLLHGNGFDDPVGIVPLFHLADDQPTEEARLAERSRLLRGHEGNLLVLAGRLTAAKGVDELIRVAGRGSDSSLVLLGNVADSAAAAALRSTPGNVSLVEDPDDSTFSLVLAAADAVLLPRRSSVGETSGPLVMAHALGTPVAMLDSGSGPEYAVPGDLVLPADTPISQFLKEVGARTWQRLAASAGDQRTNALTAYRREFASLGWI